jgi:small subunit ribosomal protein S6
MELRCYESVLVFVPELEEPQLEERIHWVKGLLEGGGAHLVEIENWGRKRLAYEIEKRKEGSYVLFRFKAPGALVEDLERNCRLSGNVIRYLTVKLKDKECEKVQEPPKEEEGEGEI